MPFPLHSRPRRIAAVAAVLVLIIAVLVSPPASATPVSTHLVPALRGEAAVKAGAYVSQRFLQLSEKRAQDITPWPGSLHNGWGVFPNQASNGAQAKHTVNPQIHLSATNPDIIYAPTLDPSGKTCIEVTTYYWQGGNAVGAWDWCAASPGFAAIAPIDANFVNTYTVPFQGLPAYTVRDVQTDPVTNSWTASLYNYTTGAWDPLYTSANTSKLTETHGGWDMFEVYTEYNPATGEGHYCTETYGSMWYATDIQVRFGSTWTTLTPANSTIPTGVTSTDFGCYSLSFTVPTANSSWQVTH